jgi:hypothetical protein
MNNVQFTGGAGMTLVAFKHEQAFRGGRQVSGSYKPAASLGRSVDIDSTVRSAGPGVADCSDRPGRFCAAIATECRHRLGCCLTALVLPIFETIPHDDSCSPIERALQTLSVLP